MKRNLKNITLIGIDCIDVERIQKALDICSEYIDFGQVKLLTSLETPDPRKVTISHIGNIEDFSKFCIVDLWKYVETDFVLLVQHDGFILNPDAWSDEFLNYDYIGAPWAVGTWETDYFPPELYGQKVVGNGGFSLRSKKFLQASHDVSKTTNCFHPEDVALCVWNKSKLLDHGIVFAPVEIAEKFSYEDDSSISGKQWDGQFGFHGLQWSNISKWIKENPKWNINQNI